MSETATTEPPVKASAPASKAPKRAAAVPPGWASPRYYAALAVLLLFGVAHLMTQQQLKVHAHKDALPLLKSLSSFNAGALMPYYRPNPIQPEPLSEEVKDTLGTTEYVSMLLDDLSREPAAPDAVASLFVSYYTGKPDMVPHIPEQCMVASGWELVSGPKVESINADDAKGNPVPIKLAVCEFSRRDNRDGKSDMHRTVVYFFYANDKYYADRSDVRVALQSPWARYAYYSKIELSFMNGTGGSAMATRDETIGATERLLKRLWPVLLHDHFPNWTAAEQAANTTRATPERG
ncbi:MAG: exosortase-associated EpsI family protein [Phycisphaerales bacterium]|nr:exosortase-associated EpsI family protein [Phycisphaerales bacterium]